MDAAPPIGTHDYSLSLILLAAAPGETVSTGDSIRDAVGNLKDLYTSTSRVPWLSDRARRTRDDWRQLDGCYDPRVYACLGPYDAAAVYLSPTVGPPYCYADKVLEAGKLLHTCLLPKLDAWVDRDFNLDFARSFQGSGSERLHPERRYVAVMKLRLNSPVLWPRCGEFGNEGFVRQLAKVSGEVSNWLNETIGPQYGSPPARSAALGMGLGWSEFVVVASSDSLDALLRLLWRLRLLGDNTWFDETKTAHTFAVSLTYLAYDSQILADSQSEFKRRDGVSKTGIQADDLADLTTKIVDQMGVDSELASEALEFSVGFSVYPGHEARLGELIADVCAPANRSLLPELSIIPKSRGMLGKSDLAGPTVSAQSAMGHLQALVFLGLLRMFLLRDGKSPFGPNARGYVNYYDSDTAVGFGSLSNGTEKQDDTEAPPSLSAPLRGAPFLPDHHEYSPRDFPVEGARILRDRLSESIASIADSSRQLQIPYARTEQIVHLVAKFSWTASHDVLWDETLPLGPSVFCLRDHLKDQTYFWEQSLKPPKGPWRAGESPHSEEEVQAARVQKTLARLENELEKLLSAFRANFHYKHLGGYLSDRTPDLNLRYQGSVQQVLSIATMALDAIVEVALGPRACIATVGDHYTPSVKPACDVVIVNLHGDTLVMPLLLETLGHEVGHLLMLELNDALEHEQSGRGQRRNPWRVAAWGTESARELYRLFKKVVEVGFFGEIDASRDIFVEVASDITEYWLLEYENRGDWIRSFTTRQLLAAPLTRQDWPSNRKEEEEDLPLVPQPDSAFVQAGLVRAILVCQILTLLDGPKGESCTEFLERSHRQELPRIRTDLRNNAILGSLKSLVEPLIVGKTPEEKAHHRREWDRLLDLVESQSPWLGDAELFPTLREFFVALKEHISTRKEEIGQSANGHTNSRVWATLVKEMAVLRGDVLKLLSPSWHVRHWIPSQRITEIENRDVLLAEMRRRWKDGERRGYELLPWRLAPQPAGEVARHLEKPADKARLPKAYLLQRGRLEPRTYESSVKLVRARGRYLATLASLLPSWRKVTLERIEDLESREEDHGQRHRR